jgi:CheY-like chemotaxis protein
MTPLAPWSVALSAIASTAPVVLVVEDLADLRSCVAAYFRVVGFDVLEAANAGQAQVTVDSAAHIDLIFSDINMPGAMDGIGLASWVSQNRPQLPVILTSAGSRPELERDAPYRRFVRKPYRLDALEHDIRELVEGAASRG